MTLLDDQNRIDSADPSGFLKDVENFASQVREAWGKGMEAELDVSGDDVTSVAVLGMGGSGISGDAARVALGNSNPRLVHTVKGYDLPGWVGRTTLVFAASYSGNTEETLSTFKEARDREARLVVISTGGELTKMSEELGLTTVAIPSGLQPRAALGFLTLPILAVLERLGLGVHIKDDVDEALELLDDRAGEFGASVATSENPAKQLAEKLLGKIPIVYGSEGLAEVAAYRWKCQFNECAKVPSWWHSIPELDHNEIVGWAQLEGLTKEVIGLICLRHLGEHQRVSKRFDATLPLIEKNAALVDQFWSRGRSNLARFLDLTYFGDFVATYLAIAQGVDPAPVEVIAELKKKLAGG